MIRGRAAVLTVSQLNRFVRSTLEENPRLREVYVQGELSNVVRHYSSGHIYFALKDDAAAVRGVMFRSNAMRLQFEPENGMMVLVRGFVTLYERDGTYQINATDIQPSGIGALQVAYEQLKRRLEAEGLFDSQYKQPIPSNPERIAVITSAGGAALQDVIHVITRRCPLVELTVFPAAVQGKDSVPELLAAFAAVRKLADRFDTVILCRGGGSMEDLMSFNDERVVRAVFACPIPVISAVGHEVDFTLCDFAADLRAPTPSAAAELAVPDTMQLRRQLEQYSAWLRDHAYRMLDSCVGQLERAKSREVIKSPLKFWDMNRQRLEDLIHLLQKLSAEELEPRRRQLAYLSVLMEELSPVKTLGRGYSITYTDRQLLRSVKEAAPGMELKTVLPDGTVISKVVAVNEKETEI